MLVASQVALSMALPFVTFPLIYITGSKLWMRLWEPKQNEEVGGRRGESDIALNQTQPQISSEDQGPLRRRGSVANQESRGQEVEGEGELERGSTGKLHLFHNKLPIAVLAWAVFAVIVLADGYVLITLFMGDN